MNTSKLLFLLLAIYSSVIISCVQDDDEINCGEGVECPEVLPHFEILGLETTNSTMNPSEENEKTDVLPSEDYVNIDDFYIYVKFNVEYLSQLQSFGGGSLMACSPIECPQDGHVGTKTGVKSFSIVTLNDYNNGYDQNDTINNIIRYEEFYRFPFATGFDDENTIENFIEKNDEIINYQYYHLKLNTGPTSSGSYQFKIILELDNGDVFETETEPVLIEVN